MTLEPDGQSIDYRRFLQRYMLVQEASESGWQHDVVRELYEALVRQGLPLRDTFALFDPHGNGKVTAAAFQRACRDCGDVEITTAQAAELLHEIDSTSDVGVRRSASGGVDLKKFIERLQWVYISGTGEHPLFDSLEPDQAGWVRTLLHRVGRAIAGGASAVDVFEQFDTEGRGHLTHRQFADAIGTVDRGPDGTATASQSQLDELAQMVDADGNGRISIWEFCEAFVSTDDASGAGGGAAGGAGSADHETSLRRQISNAVVQGIAGVIYSNRAMLRRTWQDGDPDMDGLVSVQEFEAGLRHVNIALRSPLKRAQLDALVGHAERRAETEVREGRRVRAGTRSAAPYTHSFAASSDTLVSVAQRVTMIDYERFLESFDVVDLEVAGAAGGNATRRARPPPPRPGSGDSDGGGASSSPTRRRRPPPEGTPSSAQSSVRPNTTTLCADRCCTTSRLRLHPFFWCFVWNHCQFHNIWPHFWYHFLLKFRPNNEKSAAGVMGADWSPQKDLRDGRRDR